MKKIIVILSLVLYINIAGMCILAQSQPTGVIAKIETSLYGFQYSNQDDATRLNRIEKTVYGKSTPTIASSQRIAKLKKDLSADLLGQEITPKEDTFAEESDSIKENRVAEKPIPSGSGVDYPAINELERQIFRKDFKTQDLNTRLANLEQKTLGQTFATDDFSTRVDRLRGEIKPQSLMDNQIAQSSNEFYDDEAVPLDKDYKLQGYEPPAQFDYDAYNNRNKQNFGGSSKRLNIAAVENSLFKKSFENDNTSNRLTRLESSMFGTTFNQDTEQDRINRIASAYKAQKTASKYDSNKFSQNAMTAVQIGTLILMVLACIL